MNQPECLNYCLCNLTGEDARDEECVCVCVFVSMCPKMVNILILSLSLFQSTERPILIDTNVHCQIDANQLFARQNQTYTVQICIDEIVKLIYWIYKMIV